MRQRTKILTRSVLFLVVLVSLTGHASGGEIEIKYDRETRLLPEDGESNDMFGKSVSLYGDIALIGAWADDDRGDHAGSAYVFVRSERYPWVQQTKLLAGDGAAQDRFGQSVLLWDENTALVGAPRHNGIGKESGAVYLYRREGQGWIETGKLLPDEKGAGARFGVSIAISGDSLLVGAPRYSTERGGLAREQSGAVFVFVRQANGQWHQQAKMIADDRYGYDRFGNSVALDGDTAVIGAYHDNDQGDDSGSVYVFARQGEQWNQQAKLLSVDGEKGDWFGYSVALFGDTLAVASLGDHDKGISAGAVHLFSKSTKEWRHKVKIVPEDIRSDSVFGRSIILTGNSLFIGAKFGSEWPSNVGRPGVIYMYSSHEPENWSLEGKLIARYGQLFGEMGNSMAFDRGTVLVGAYHRNERIDSYGAAYVFEAETNR